MMHALGGFVVVVFFFFPDPNFPRASPKPRIIREQLRRVKTRRGEALSLKWPFKALLQLVAPAPRHAAGVRAGPPGTTAPPRRAQPTTAGQGTTFGFSHS